jgi:multidrug efflux pump subunit AcrB
MFIAGLIALTRMPVEQFPDIVPPQVSVTAFYPGAGAEVVEQTVAQPIEDQVIGVDDMLYMRSTSGADGSYSLTSASRSAPTPTSPPSTSRTASPWPSRCSRRRCARPA